MYSFLPGWFDAPLSEQGIREAMGARRLLQEVETPCAGRNITHCSQSEEYWKQSTLLSQVSFG